MPTTINQERFMIRVYLDMVGDLFHVGHLNIIKKSKAMGDYLIVGVHSDESVASYKRLPIIKHRDRVDIIESCRYVDEVIAPAPLIITENFINQHNINLVIHGCSSLICMFCKVNRIEINSYNLRCIQSIATV